jgi:hypothetical protein
MELFFFEAYATEHTHVLVRNCIQQKLIPETNHKARGLLQGAQMLTTRADSAGTWKVLGRCLTHPVH